MPSNIEIPSGKKAADENFPVGSWLLLGSLRVHVSRFYTFARAIDDIADTPVLTPEEKIDRLEAFRMAVQYGDGDPEDFFKAHQLRLSLQQTNVSVCHALHLIKAFKQDTIKTRYQSWEELIDYCDYSAAPVGRFLLDLHGESKEIYPESDALCNALQILNHLQDCQADHRTLDRVYLPLDWMEQCGATIEDLQQDRASAGLFQVIHLSLDGVDELLKIAQTLSERVISQRLSMESAVIFLLARRLSTLLRRSDPIAGRVSLSKRDFFFCGIKGMVQEGLSKTIHRKREERRI